MAKCPKCGKEIATPKKQWELKGGRSGKTIVFGIFYCPSCDKKFRAAIKKS